MKYLAIVLSLVSLTALAEELPHEVSMANEAGGLIVLTDVECNFPKAVKLGYKYDAYATEAGSKQIHLGCWVSPSTSNAPKIPNVKIIPLVNTWWESGEVATFPRDAFEIKEKPSL